MQQIDKSVIYILVIWNNLEINKKSVTTWAFACWTYTYKAWFPPGSRLHRWIGDESKGDNIILVWMLRR